jgi:hypothetical protein
MMLDDGSFSEGEKMIRRGNPVESQSLAGPLRLGRALLDEKRISEAQVSAEHARLLAPGAPIVYRLLSNIHLEEKEYPALLQDIEACLKLDPDNPAGIRQTTTRAGAAEYQIGTFRARIC